MTKSYCKSNSRVSEGTKVGHSSVAKIVTWSQPNRESKRDTETDKPVATEGDCSKCITENLKRENRASGDVHGF